MKKLIIDYDILYTFLSDDEKEHHFTEWDKDWMKAVGGYGYDKVTHSIITYYITKTGHITVYIPYDEYVSKYKAKQRDNKLTSIGI